VKRLNALPLLLSVLVFSACLEPKYMRPKMPTPAPYKERDAHWKPAQPSDSIPRGKWWELFGDARLARLEEQVLSGNQSIQEAAAQFRQSRAEVSSALTGFFPTVTTDPSVTRQRSYSGGANTYSNSTLYQLPGTASWEPDFWGQVRLSVQSAKGNAQASAANLESAKLSLQSQLAADYFSVEAIDMQEAILSSATVDYESNLQLTTNRFNAGVASQSDVAQAESQLDSARAQATDLLVTRAQLEHAIAVLLGVSPSTFTLEVGTIAGPPPELPTGLPSQLLERRPDIAAAERQVFSANAGIGIARAAYFPVISIIAMGGFETGYSGQIFDWSSRFFSLGASAAETLIDFGKRGAQRKQAWAVYDASVADYRQTVLTAFQQVEDDLAALRLLAVEADQQSAALKAAQDSLRLTLEQYTSGVVSYLNVIQAQNIELTSETATAQILGRRWSSAVNLLRDIGGGWNTSQLPTGSGLRSTFPSGSHVQPPAR
jgi:NodT family efflux transporter outer membrane factor (OMF) lipoprotein